MKRSDHKSMSFRLSPEARRILNDIARRESVSMTGVLEFLLRWVSVHEGPFASGKSAKNDTGETSRVG